MICESQNFVNLLLEFDSISYEKKNVFIPELSFFPFSPPFFYLFQ